MTDRAAGAGGVPPALSRWTAEVDSELRRLVLGRDSLLGRMASYQMGWVDAEGAPARAGGKYLRPNLCLWAAEARGEPASSALAAACAIELGHNFTLVHDDVQDGDELRRGRPTVWAVWGEAQAINGGDGLFAIALGTLLQGEPDARRAAAARIIIEALLEVIEGQCLDLQNECRPDTGPETYLRMVEAKTGALFGACLEAGAAMSGADPDEAGHFRRAGRLLGIAFQLRDDWLGVWGQPELTGKSKANDLVRRKGSHPVIAAYDAADPSGKEELRRLYQSRGPEDEPRIRHLLMELGGPDLTVDAATTRAREAVTEIQRTGLEADRVEEFAHVAHHVAQRNR
ncbi:MAG TPA: polyprenyl synthetase family protein [Candidatus Dormibacteraeota bacterium]|nr:polyprenyl synthetase family protein [Candidatus Dormibacteraeota bacterium]